VRKTSRRVGSFRPGVRLRSSLAAVAVVGLAMLVAAPVMVFSLHQSLVRDTELSAGLRAEQLKNELVTNGPTAVQDLLRTARGERSVAQVVDARGRVVASSVDLQGLPEMTHVAPPPSGRRTTVEAAPDRRDGDHYLIVARGARVGGQPYVVLVGESLAGADRSTRSLAVILAAFLPLLLVVVGVATYLVVGRSLRPVEAIRAKAAVVSSQALSDRFPEPEVHDEIGRLALTMNDMLERLQRAQDAQRRFVADAGHELRSPLATLRSILEVSLVHPGTRTTGSTEAMLAETERLQRLVDDLVVLARSGEGPRRVEEDVDLEDLVQDERSRVRATTDLEVDGDLVPLQVRGDRHELAQMLRNVVDNGVHQASSRMTIEVRHVDEGVGPVAILAVGDDGQGIPEADRDRVFDRFVRLDSARARHEGGSGLGLAIVRELAGRHGGTVRIGDSPLGGALVEVRLPMATARQDSRSGAIR
jgi:signal transduction histidine kinase